jgi:hypothetical protein
LIINVVPDGFSRCFTAQSSIGTRPEISGKPKASLRAFCFSPILKSKLLELSQTKNPDKSGFSAELTVEAAGHCSNLL